MVMLMINLMVNLSNFEIPNAVARVRVEAAWKLRGPTNAVADSGSG